MPAWGRFMQADPIGYRGGDNLYAYVGNDPLNNTDPGGLDTLSLSLAVNIQLGPVVIQWSEGLAIDTRGNVARLDVGGAGLGVGAKVSGGVNFSWSNGQTVQALSSYFNNQSIGGAAGPSASLDIFEAVDLTAGRVVIGGGPTIGFGLGGGATNTVTFTNVTPLFSLSQTFSNTSPSPTTAPPVSSSSGASSTPSK
jgi:hypothetical protein